MADLAMALGVLAISSGIVATVLWPPRAKSASAGRRRAFRR